MSSNHVTSNGGIRFEETAESRMRKMEKKMDREGAEVLHGTESPTRGSQNNASSVGGLRPLIPAVSRARTSTPRGNHHQGAGVRAEQGKTYFLNVEKIYNDRDASTNLDSGDDESYGAAPDNSLDEELKRPIYVTCPDTGSKMVRMQFDVHGFESRDIRVKVSSQSRKLIVFALHRENESGRKSTTEFCRRIKLPVDAEVDELRCSFQDEILTLEAPVKKEKEEPNRSVVSVSEEEPLNTPFLRDSELGVVVHVNAEVGTVFKADDVVVKLKGNRRLVVLAERHETEDALEGGRSTLAATLRREFQLPSAINPASLKAGLTHDGILNVSALTQDEHI